MHTLTNRMPELRGNKTPVLLCHSHTTSEQCNRTTIWKVENREPQLFCKSLKIRFELGKFENETFTKLCSSETLILCGKSQEIFANWKKRFKHALLFLVQDAIKVFIVIYLLHSFIMFKVITNSSWKHKRCFRFVRRRQWHIRKSLYSLCKIFYLLDLSSLVRGLACKAQHNINTISI